MFLAATVFLLVLHQHQCAATEAHVDSFVAVFDAIRLAYMTWCLDTAVHTEEPGPGEARYCSQRTTVQGCLRQNGSLPGAD